jgi:hypothetical protein
MLGGLGASLGVIAGQTFRDRQDYNNRALSAQCQREYNAFMAKRAAMLYGVDIPVNTVKKLTFREELQKETDEWLNEIV